MVGDALARLRDHGVWTATTSYPVGSVFRNGTTCYVVSTEYVSGATFGSTDTTNTTVVTDASGSAVVAPTTRTLYTKGGRRADPLPVGRSGRRFARRQFLTTGGADL